MDVVVLIGRIILSSLFIASAFNHLTRTNAMAGYATARGVPWARWLVMLSGVQILVGGLMVLLGVAGDVGALLLLIFLFATAVLIHHFWTDTDPMTRLTELVQFEKDIALAGAAILTYALFAYAGHDLGLTLTGPLVHLS